MGSQGGVSQGAADDLEPARARLCAAGQQHLVLQAAALGGPAGAALLREAAAEDWDALRQAALSAPASLPPALRPPPALTLRRQQAVGGLRARLALLGAEWLREGRVATLLLAGGQGTRLGHAGPKGTFVLGPGADRSLYALLAERVARASREAGRPIPLYVLTSDETDAATREAFAEPARLGLAAEQVRFVRQASLPVLDSAGRGLLAAPDRLLRAPDGHGGALSALARDGVLDALAAQGIGVLTTFQVDNPLARPLDPVLLGWMRERSLQALGKAVRREVPEERVGVFGRDLDGRLRVVEYTELAGLGGAEGLTLGSIAIHAFDLAWLRGLLVAGASAPSPALPTAGPLASPLALPLALPLHAARKGVVAWIPEAGRAAPLQGIKLERFLFDVYPHAPRAEVQEVARAREFAPIKNADGVDSPATARALVAAEVRRWHAERGRAEPVQPELRPLDMDGGA